MTHPKRKRKLRNYLLIPKYQLQFALISIFSGTVLTIFNCSSFYYFTKKLLGTIMSIYNVLPEIQGQIDAEMTLYLVVFMALSFGFTLLFSCFCIIVAHRTAGPLFHFNRVFNEIRAGKTDARINLRAKDDFREVANSFNLMMDELAKKPKA